MMIFLNKNAIGPLQRFLFGLAALVDGLVRVFSLGILATTFPVSLARWQTKRHFEKMKGMKDRYQ